MAYGADQRVTSGVVTSVGTVATAPSGNGSDSSPTVDVKIRPLHPATGRLDKEPVEVAITTATTRHGFVVPVNALLALASGGYAVEVAEATAAECRHRQMDTRHLLLGLAMSDGMAAELLRQAGVSVEALRSRLGGLPPMCQGTGEPPGSCAAGLVG